MSNHEKYIHWNPLDNAAKIFPPTSTKSDTKVFRFACELYENIDEHILQQALEKCIEIFPLFRSVIKKGLFWYYLENSTMKPIVKLETKVPCSPLYKPHIKNLLFEVTYYKKRINLEVYHALTDGTGALHFLQTLVFYYLTIKHADEFQNKVPSIDYDASITQKTRDSFQKYYSKLKGPYKQRKLRCAYRIKGERLNAHQLHIVEGVVSVKAVLQEAHRYHTTITIFLAAIFMCAISEEMSMQERKQPVVLTVPVNLRQYFSSESVRNFFSVINVAYNFNQDQISFEEVITTLDSFFKQELTSEKLNIRLNNLASLEHNWWMRIVPLALKDYCLKVANRLAEKEITAALSNIGKVKMPDAFKSYIRLFDVFVSTNRMQLCMCSYEDQLTLSFTSPFISTEIQKHFFRTLTKSGIEVTLITNPIKEER